MKGIKLVILWFSFFIGLMLIYIITNERKTPNVIPSTRLENIQLSGDSLFILNKNDIDKIDIIKLNDFKGRGLYVKNCKFCHGDRGHGDGIKSKLDSTLCPHDITIEKTKEHDVYFVILNGKNGMPSHSEKLNEDEIWLLVIYVNKIQD